MMGRAIYQAEPRIVMPPRLTTLVLTGILPPVRHGGEWLITPYVERINERGLVEWHIRGRFTVSTPCYVAAVWAAAAPIRESMLRPHAH